MKIHWVVVDVTAAGPPTRKERDFLEVIFDDVIWQIQAAIMVGESLCDLGILSWALCNNCTYDHSMNMKWLVANVTAVESPDRAERAILEVILAWRCFDQFKPCLWLRSHFVM